MARTVRLSARATSAGLTLTPELSAQLDAYLAVLAKWNRRINLTAFDLSLPTDDAIDRLIIEPLAAAQHVRPFDDLAIDLGSGAGSPAIPLHLAAPGLRFVLVESKLKKTAFLREVARQLDLSGIEIAQVRFEELLTRVDLHEAANLVTLRAVRADATLWRTVDALLRPRGRVFWFGGVGKSDTPMPPHFKITSTPPLIPSRGVILTIVTKQA